MLAIDMSPLHAIPRFPNGYLKAAFIHPNPGGQCSQPSAPDALWRLQCFSQQFVGNNPELAWLTCRSRPTALAYGIENVVATGAKKQVCRVAAGRVIASMTNMEAGIDGDLVRQSVGDAVRAIRDVVHREPSIRTAPASPSPAIVIASHRYALPKFFSVGRRDRCESNTSHDATPQPFS